MRWTLSPQPDAVLVEQLSKELNVDTILASLLVGRGIDAFAKAKSFFRPSLEELHDPFLMKGMNEAVHRIQKAVGNNETIMVYGDYDVDGTTAVALMSSFLSSFYDKVTTYIPDRYKEGYGISYAGIDYAHDNDISLIIALDCGIKAIDKVKYAKEKGIDFIICDHHRPGKFVPDAVAVLDPKQHDCSYPYDELCGCGVGFKLCQALVQHNDWEFEILIPYLDLVATAIAADIVPITGENRILCYHGLNVINTSPRAGFKSIIEQVKKNILDITDVVFIIAPRINAAGRMKHGLYAVDLLVEQDLDQARLKAKEIDRYNQDRRELDQLITEEALQQIHDNKEEKLFTSVVFKEDWHKGVIGIVASRLTETHYRPTLVFTKNGDKLAASARSVSGYDVYNALEQCSEFIEQFGGHKYAAGLTMQPEQFLNFKKRFEEVVCATIDKKLLTKELKIDALLPLERITGKLYRILKQMAPFGPRNMRPVFLSRAVYDSGYAKRIGENGKHLKLAIKPHVNSSLQIPAIGFNLGDCISIIQNNKPFDVVYVLEENSWQGVTSLQLRIKDLKPH